MLKRHIPGRSSNRLRSLARVLLIPLGHKTEIAKTCLRIVVTEERRYGRQLVFSSLFAPLFGGNFPDFRQELSRDIVMLLHSNYSHSCLLRNSAGRTVYNCLWSTQHREAEHVEPIVVCSDYGFSHKTLVLP